MVNALLLALVALSASAVVLILVLLKKVSKADSSGLAPRLDALEKAQERTERAIKEELAQSRKEFGVAAREQRQELAESLRTLGDSAVQRMTDAAAAQKRELEVFSNRLAAFATASGERLDLARTESANGAKQLREEVIATLGSISDTTTKTMNGFAAIQQAQLEAFAHRLNVLVQSSGEKLDGARAESAAGGKQLREEVVATLKGVSETMAATLKDLATAEKAQLEAFSGQIALLTRTSGEKLDGIRTESATGAKQLREEVIATLNGITETTTKTMGGLANAQNVQLEAMSGKITTLLVSIEKKLEEIKGTVEARLLSLQNDNAKHLDQMRQTVDEKLQGTLEKRLGESFRQVSERLEQVHKGLGEMQSLATGVGDLKKVLTNVKTRGTWGEVQLGAMLEQVLNPDQFGRNVATGDGAERVEFAIKLPGQGPRSEDFVWLPIDAKFPIEDYQRLMEAQENAMPEAVEMAAKQLESRVKACARDICDKYLNPPKTTDFAILFLPIEGLFAEVIRRTGLTESVQHECRVVIAGPTTLWAILNSLQMGFRTLAIQQRSSEVWTLLGAVKTEWGKYGDVLDAVQKRLTQASDTIEKAKVRSRAVGRKLKDVQELPAAEAAALLPSTISEEEAELTESEDLEVNA